MKFRQYLLFSFTIACFSLSQAANATSAKTMHMPFGQEPIFADDHSGLRFNYNLTVKHAKKIICHFSKIYKGYLEFPVHGKMEESAVFGDETSATLILTNKGRTYNNQYHIDPIGSVRINAVNGSHGKGSQASAACHYAP